MNLYSKDMIAQVEIIAEKIRRKEPIKMNEKDILMGVHYFFYQISKVMAKFL